jgi:hypothetical protein
MASPLSRFPWLLLLVLGVLGLGVAWWALQGESRAPRAGGDSESAANPEQPSSVADSPSGPRTPAVPRTQSAGVEPSADSPEVLASAPTQVTVSGRVLERNRDRPVAFVDVIFASKGAEWTATSDEQGQYSLRLLPGSYQVRAIGDRVMAIGLPPFLLGRASRSYDLRVAQHSVIRGQALGPDGSPATGAVIVPQVQGSTASGFSARGELGSAEVQSDGSFELFTLHGNLVLHATSESSAGSALVPALKPGEERDKVKILVVPNGHIEGNVRGPSGAALGDSRVLISMRIPGTGEYDRIPVSTNSRGHFRYQVLRPAHTIVEATARGFAQSTPISFALKAGESRKGIVIVLHEANLSLSGRVVDENDAPLAYVEVAQGQEGSKERYKKTITGSEGQFTLTGLGPGPHRLRARKSGYQQTRLREIEAPASDLRIVMAPSASQEPSAESD